ncbi:MAG: SdrD B-like domain-containing protein [Methanothrix sp.]|nr:SdrD B-like domain-containing protein [Methanothrix sp.]
MAGKSGHSGWRALAAASRRSWQHDLMRIKILVGTHRRLLLMALMAMLLFATAQGAWVKVGSFDTPGSSLGVALAGSHAYMADGGSGLQILDVSDPTSPFLAGHYPESSSFPVNAVALDGSYAYVGYKLVRMDIIDVSNPASPSLASRISLSSNKYVKGIALAGSYAYLIRCLLPSQPELRIFDVSDPYNPVSKSMYAISDPYGVAVSGSYLYVADGYSGLKIIDVSDPADPFRAGSCDTPADSRGVAVSGSYAYVADSDSGLQIIDVSDPYSPFIASSCDTPGTSSGVALAGSYAYVADGDSGLQIIDVSNPYSPFIAGSYDTPGYSNGVAVSGSYVYVADGDSGLQIIAQGATLQGKAWRDLNGDGLQDAGEPDEPNVAVALLNGSGSPIAGRSAITGSDGSYSFTDLVPGDYYVQFTQPSGMTFSPKDQDADDSADSDVNGQGQSDKITLDPGQSKSVDAGLYENQIIINEIYPNPYGNDNNDGTASWERVELKNVGTTDFNVGQWTVKDDDNPFILATIPAGTIIPAGDYLVVHLSGSSGDGISNGDGDPVILCNFDGVEMDRVDCPASSSKEGLSYSCIPDASDNWGFWGDPTFGGSLSSDPLPGAPNMADEDYGDAPDTFKTLRSSNGARHFVTGPYLGTSVDSEPDGQPSASAGGDGSDEDGAVFSSVIIAGTTSTFTVTASAPGILQAWMDFNGDGDFEDAGEHIASDQSLSAGETKLDFSVPTDAQVGDTYARLRFCSSSGLASYGLALDGEVEDYLVKITSRYILGDYVWVDENGNGLQDAGEKGLEGVTVNLRDSGGNIVSNQTSTDEGEFIFENPTPGTYNLEFIPPAGYSITGKDAGTDDEKDSDADPVTHLAGPITVELGLSDNSWDAGFYQPVSISGMKFEDLNGNGVKDSGEPGLAGWTIKLMKDANEVARTETDANGTYTFLYIEPGSYTVEEAAQAGWTQTSPAGNAYNAVSSSGMLKITRADQSEVSATEVNFGNRRQLDAFQVEITANQQTVLSGQKLIFYITVNRDSNIDLNSLTVKYTLPKGLNFVDSNHSPLNVTQNADGTTTIIWTFTAFSSQMAAQVAGSQSVSESPTDALETSTTITVTTEVQPDAPQSLTGTVVVTGVASEATIAEAKDTVSVNVDMIDQPVHLNKTSDLKEVWPGATIGYTITYESLTKASLTGVVITEQASSDLIFLSASPAPDQGTDNIWSIGDLGPGEKGTINVFFQVKNTTNLSFFSQSSISGSGFVNSYRRLSTETESQGLRNIVTLTYDDQLAPVSISYLVKLRDSDGTSLLKTEHGSGEYRSEEVASLQMQNRSIRTAGSLKAIFRPTSFLLPGGKSINYDSDIASSTITRNRATQASTSNSVRYDKSLEMDEKILVDKNETSISVEGSMQGQAHLGVLKKDSQAVKPLPVFESSQDYTGAFQFNESLEDYGSNVLFGRNATGQGQAASDQRLKKSQRSYEHGSGSYQSEELISSAESYIAKDLSVSHDAENGYGKWKSGIWSRSSGQSYLGQEISSADYIKEETKAGGLNDMSSNLSYSGRVRFRAAYESGNRSMLDLDEEYVGQYTIQRRVHLGGASHFDLPHITLNKTGRLVPGTVLADYTITVQNDGNAALGPVYVWDVFPAGTDYLSSSIKPARLQPGYANWSLLYLGIGQSVTINLRLNVTDPQDELVNLVYASGGHNDEWVTAGNMSVIQFGWLNCGATGLFMDKQARVDPADGRVIWYRILIQNRANVSLVAQITDRLPAGMRLLNASAEPQIIGSELVWVTTAIPAGGSRFIEYRVSASQDGRFVNTALAEAHALDGSGGASTQASATVTLGEATSYSEDGWRPPEWGLDRMEMICDDEIAGDGNGCSSCPSCSCPLDE